MSRGPVEVLALAFPLSVTPDQMVACLRRPVDSGHVRLVDLVFLVRGEDGSVEPRDVEHERFPMPGLAGMQLDPHTLLSDEDLVMLAESLEPGQQGLVAVVEHVWARGVAEELRGLGAELELYARIPAEDVEAAFFAEGSG